MFRRSGRRFADKDMRQRVNRQACLSTFSPVPGAVGGDCAGRVSALLLAAGWVRVATEAVVDCGATCGDETGVTLMSMVLVLGI
jgi:hypothetical protein